MRTIQIFGTGCAKCNQLTENAKQAAAQSGIECKIEHVTGVAQIAAAGVWLTPALAIDGKVHSAGKLLDVETIKRLLTG